MNISQRLFALAAAGVLILVGAACGDDDGDGEAVEDPTTTSTEAEATEVSLLASLSGEEEVPGPGVTDGTGMAEITVSGDQLCYKLNATMGEEPTAAHIHQGATGESGDVVIDLMPTFTAEEAAFVAETCITPEAAALTSVTENPAGYYVNIHTAEHPAGAVRGQLGPSGS